MNDALSQNERDHARRARSLLKIFGSKEKLAEFLHQQYRATALAMARAHGETKRPLLHDHGFGDCYGAKKRYFIRRAAWLLDPRGTLNGGRRPHIVDQVLAL